MDNISDIEAAIERLPAPEVDELATWLEGHRARRSALDATEAWLQRARGAAIPEVSTTEVMALTRGEE
ncbi:MAG: hypothetical protein ACKV2V_07455 [Blastocatellia bacterium]